MTTLGEQFVAAIAEKDHDALHRVLAADVDFKGLTPGRLWEGTTVDEVDEIVLGSWFEADEHVSAVPVLETDQFADVERVGYRVDVETPDGPRVVEQQAYYRVEDDRIAHLRIVCSGFRVR